MTDTKNTIYLNTAACGRIPQSVLQPGIDLYRNFEDTSSAASEHWRSAEYPQIKNAIAHFMGASVDNIALVPNFSWAMNAVVQALKGDEKVLLYKKDYPSVYIPFVRNKFNIVWIDDEDGFFIDLEKILSVVEAEQVDVVAISHVQWQSGFKIDLQALCSRCKALRVSTIIDATQSLGALDINVPAIGPDVLINSNYKWMNAGFGTGIMYMGAVFMEKYPAVVSGAHSSFYAAGNAAYTGINDYEPGGVNMFGLSILHQAVTEKMAYGLDRIEAHNARLTALLLEKLAALPVQLIGDAGMQHRSSIVVIEDAPGLHEHLKQNNIITTQRNGRIRISMHFHNTEADIDAMAACIGSRNK